MLLYTKRAREREDEQAQARGMGETVSASDVEHFICSILIECVIFINYSSVVMLVAVVVSVAAAAPRAVVVSVVVSQLSNKHNCF
jgi:hypothetical protein